MEKKVVYSRDTQKADGGSQGPEELRTEIKEMEEKLLRMKRTLEQLKRKDTAASRHAPDSSEFGYVYILQADLTKLCCDYWFGASGGVLEPSQTEDFPKSADKVQVRDVPGDKDMDRDIWKMYTYEPWPNGIPKPYTVRVNNSGRANTADYVSQVGRYLRAAAQHAYAPSRQPFHSTFRRSTCPLMATPLIGTGWGGNQQNTGDMAQQLLPTLYSLANELRIDVALVTNDKEVYAMMQWARSNLLNSHKNGGPKSPHHAALSGSRFLDAKHKQRISDLSHHAIQGRLALFIGAGASMGSNVPDWGGLVESLAEELGLTPQQREEFSQVDVYTKAAVLEAEVERRQKEKKSTVVISPSDLEGGEKTVCLGDYVSRRLIHARYSVVHALLAALPVQEAITTNFDDLFEKAWCLHEEFAVLPHAPMRRGRASSKWLLKMHGCVTTPEDIVLTKSHYIRYAERYAALAGIVQASLLTKHLLFVGFSFDDDNFQRIFDPVRKAKRQQEQREKNMGQKYSGSSGLSSGPWKGRGKRLHLPRRYLEHDDPNVFYARKSPSLDSPSDESDWCGTALLLQHSVLKEELWQGDICMTSMGPAASPVVSTSRDQHISSLARKQEIFLDILASTCAVSLRMEFLMDDKFEKALSPSEVQLREVVRSFEENLKTLPKEATDNVAFGRIQDMLKSLGSYY